jgi:hypothetical protein
VEDAAVGVIDQVFDRAAHIGDPSGCHLLVGEKWWQGVLSVLLHDSTGEIELS